jgi:hypothetical protein
LARAKSPATLTEGAQPLHILLPLSGALGQSERVLVAREMVRPPMSLVRAQVTSTSTVLAADGATWASFPADAPRFAGASRSLLIEGQRTNTVRNPRAEGAVPGILGGSGVLPTYWSDASSSAPRNVEVLGTGISLGASYIDLRLSGTQSSGAQITIGFEGTTAVAAASGQVWTASCLMQKLAGSTPKTTVRMHILERTAAGGSLVDSGATFDVEDGNPARITHTRTLTGGTTAFIFSGLRIVPTTDVPYDVTYRLWLPQMEQALFASTPILPATGAPIASTRGADLASALLASLGIGGNGACTILAAVMISQAMDGLNAQTLVQMDDGTNTNRNICWNASGTALALRRTSAGNNASSGTLGDFTPGVPFRIGMTIDGAGRLAASFNGGAVQSLTGAVTSGLTTLRLGNTAAGNAPMFGETGVLTALPHALSDADLAARTAALPL